MNSRLIIIDAYNVIHRSPVLRPGPGRTLAESRQKLLNLLAWAYGGNDGKFLVVFDGAADVHSEDDLDGRVQVRWSKPPEKADDVIRRLVEEQIGRDERVTVVTSDLEVARHARGMGADVSIADLFIASALGPGADAPGGEAAITDEKPPPLSKREIEEWADLFKLRPGSAAPNGDSDLEP